MRSSNFNSCIKTIMCSDKPGFGFVQDLVEFIMGLDYKETHINNIVVLWDYLIKDHVQTVDYFSSSKLNINGLNRAKITSADHVILPSDDLINAYISPSIFIWKEHFAAIPINGMFGEGEYIPAKGAMVFLSNEDDINLTLDQLNMLHCLLNERPPIIEGARCVEDFLKVYRERGKSPLSLGSRLQKSILAIEQLSGCCGNAGVKYLSIWKLNNFLELKRDVFLKQYEVLTDTARLNTSHSIIRFNDTHFLNTLRDMPEVGVFCPINLLSYEDVSSSFADKEVLQQQGLDSHTLTAILIPILVNGSIPSLDVYCVYVKDILYTPLVSNRFQNQLQNFIENGLADTNTQVRSELVTAMMHTYFNMKEQNSFYEEVTKVIARSNSVSECWVYTKNGTSELLYARLEDINNPSTFLSKRYTIGNRECYIPHNYTLDKDFIEFLTQLEILDSSTSNTVFYRGEKQGCLVKNALCISIQNSNQTETSGLIVLINRCHQQDSPGSKDFDVLTMDSAFITYLSALYLHQFGLWQNAVSRKNYLLKKLRHEIPHCTSVIGDKIQSIRQELKERDYIVPSVFAKTNTIELNRSRINILSKFFGAVDYEDYRFAEGLKEQDIVDIIESNLPLFKEEASYKGTNVVFNKSAEKCKVLISDFYPLAIVNIINNAIRYCGEGTTVVIDLYEDRLEVLDAGIPILDEERDIIFKEGYRSVEAKQMDAEGFGYGLHITKRVLEAHGSIIYADSDLLTPRNYYLEHEILTYVKNLKPAARNAFLYDNVEESEYPMVNQLLRKIKTESYAEDIEKDCFYNKRQDLFKNWIENDATNSHPYFIEMEDVWFSKPLSKVTFTIEFGPIL